MPSNPSHATVMIAHHSADGEYMHVSRYVCVYGEYMQSVRIHGEFVWYHVFFRHFAATLQVTWNYFKMFPHNASRQCVIT